MNNINVTIDFETGGLEPDKHPVTEIGAVKFNDAGEVLGIFQTFVKLMPGYELSDFIKNLTKITPEQLDSGMWEDKALAALHHFCFSGQGRADNVQLISHHFPFEYGFLNRQFDFGVGNFVCTRVMSRLLEPNESAKMEDVYPRTFGYMFENHRRALPDAFACKDLFLHMKPLLEEKEIEYKNVLVQSAERRIKGELPTCSKVVTLP